MSAIVSPENRELYRLPWQYNGSMIRGQGQGAVVAVIPTVAAGQNDRRAALARLLLRAPTLLDIAENHRQALIAERDAIYEGEADQDGNVDAEAQPILDEIDAEIREVETVLREINGDPA